MREVKTEKGPDLMDARSWGNLIDRDSQVDPFEEIKSMVGDLRTSRTLNRTRTKPSTIIFLRCKIRYEGGGCSILVNSKNSIFFYQPRHQRLNLPHMTSLFDLSFFFSSEARPTRTKSTGYITVKIPKNHVGHSCTMTYITRAI